mmetsp:Transcript_2014/g.3075  ORF Transcript_2014/g.3075 Transcript_2014/m.3075 type:complete len:233 (+) Transcript_2014:122-820(+)
MALNILRLFAFLIVIVSLSSHQAQAQCDLCCENPLKCSNQKCCGKDASIWYCCPIDAACRYQSDDSYVCERTTPGPSGGQSGPTFLAIIIPLFFILVFVCICLKALRRRFQSQETYYYSPPPPTVPSSYGYQQVPVAPVSGYPVSGYQTGYQGSDWGTSALAGGAAGLVGGYIGSQFGQQHHHHQYGSSIPPGQSYTFAADTAPVHHGGDFGSSNTFAADTAPVHHHHGGDS